MSIEVRPKAPGYFSDYNSEDTVEYINSLVNQGSYLSGVNSYIHESTTSTNAYQGGVYSPTQNRIYFVPHYQADPANAVWHYLDCSDGTVGTYANPGNAVNLAYSGGVYSPVQNRIYFVPFFQAPPANAVWHYIECSDGSVGTYANPGNATSLAAYQGGVYSPVQNRIYFVPNHQAHPSNTVWHYIDCNDGTVGTYANPGNAPNLGAYSGGVYSPVQNRIYFSPHYQADPSYPVWHYIECSDGSVGTYANPGNAVGSAYIGGVYSPVQNRIYFVPYFQAETANAVWHYIDCDDGSVGTYANPGNAPNLAAYSGGVYSPVQNRIYFVPFSQADPSNAVWHYIECSDGSVGTYANPGNAVASAYVGGVYSPVQNRIYFVPNGQAHPSNAVWHCIDMMSSANTSKIFMARAEYNN